MLMSFVLRRTAYWTLVAVTAFNALSAVGGGIAIDVTDGSGLPTSMLAGSPFTTFLVPGLILAVIVGGTQVLAVVFLLRRPESALLWSAIAGCGMVIWIFVEIGIVGGVVWLQALYFATGLVQLILVVSLLGIMSSMLRLPGFLPACATRARPPHASGYTKDSPTA